MKTEVAKLLTRDSRYGVPRAMTPEKWKLFESKLNEEQKVPESYKDFMFTYNGGSFIECEHKGSEIGTLTVSILLPMFDDDQDKDVGSVTTAMEHSVNEMSEGLLPIGYDPGGSFFFLGINKKNFDKIFFKDNYELSKYIKLSDSFEEFISHLEPEDE